MRDAWQRLHGAFHVPSSRDYGRVESVVWVLILASIALLLPDVMGAELPEFFEQLDAFILLLFALEVTLRIATFRPPALDFYALAPGDRLVHHVTGRLRFILTPLILIDLLTVLAAAPVFRGLRALRLLRLLRSNQVFRYSSPFQGIAKAFEENALLFGFAFSVFGGVATIGGLSIFLLERETNPVINTLPDALWWSLVTLTTVGFGDITPESDLGRVVGGVLMVCGMFTLALFAGIVGQSLTSSVLAIREEQFRMRPHVDHIVLCGHGPGTTMLLDSVRVEFDLSVTKVVVFAPGDRPRDLPPEFHWIAGDPTKETELAKVRVRYAAAVIIVGSRQVLPQLADATTILTAFTIRRFQDQNPLDTPRAAPLYLVAEVLDAQNVEHARTAGCDEVIETTRLGFDLVAHAVRMPGTAAIMGQLAQNTGHNIYVGVAPDDVALPMAFGLLAKALKERVGVLVLGLRKDDNDLMNPPDDLVVCAGDEIVYMATSEVLFVL
jgi:voltage-gated potassium channel